MSAFDSFLEKAQSLLITQINKFKARFEKEDFAEAVPDGGGAVATTAESFIPSVKQELSGVASNPKNNMLFIIIIGIVGLVVVYNVVLAPSEDVDTAAIRQAAPPLPKDVVKPANVDGMNNVANKEVPQLPDLPKISNPVPPKIIPPDVVKTEVKADEVKITSDDLAAPAMPDLKSVSAVGTTNPPLTSTPAIGNTDTAGVAPPPTTEALPAVQDNATNPLTANAPVISDTSAMPDVLDGAVKERMLAKRKSQIMQVSGSATAVPAAATTPVVAAVTLRGDVSYLLPKGKMIPAVLENAINTDFAGEVYAKVTQDVYSHNGKNLLIQKGARVFGTFDQSIDSNYGRIKINWNRLDLTNGYTLTFASPSIDGLGRVGIQGMLDNKYRQKVSSSVLSTALNIAFAKALDTVISPSISGGAVLINQNIATNLQTDVGKIYNNAVLTDDAAKARAMQNSITTAITDTNSDAYKTMTTQFATLSTTAANKSDYVMYTALPAIITSLIQGATSASSISKSQQAAIDGFSSFQNTVNGMATASTSQNPSVSIDQGREIKILVTQDYAFPKDTVSTIKVIK